MARRRRQSEEALAARQIARLLNTPGGRRALLILAVIAAIALAAIWVKEKLDARRAQGSPPATQPTTSTGPIRIATWNLRKFSDRADNPPDLVTIARIIQSSGFDLVVIQEVQRTGQVVERLRRQLNEPWRHAVSDRTGNNERYGILYRSDRIELLDGPRLLSGPDAMVFDRAPLLAGFRAGAFDFTVVSVHLWYGDKANNPRREREAQTLARLASDLAFRGPERDVIVLGDFNEMRADGNLHYFESMGWKRLNTDYTNLGSKEVYDNLLIDPRYTREFMGAAGAVPFDEAYFANDDRAASQAVSDHRPAWAEFATAGPDDD
jgi:endonuclease/exonuclease/phosphatase family metal-dependent hydrolase